VVIDGKHYFTFHAYIFKCINAQTIKPANKQAGKQINRPLFPLFIIYLLILQQLEGNLIYPRVVGSSIGLPGIWVLAAIMLGSGLGGVVGMLVGVPISAAAYKLLKDATKKKEEECMPKKVVKKK